MGEQFSLRPGGLFLLAADLFLQIGGQSFVFTL
jgi:hypothetical protein